MVVPLLEDCLTEEEESSCWLLLLLMLWLVGTSSGTIHYSEDNMEYFAYLACLARVPSLLLNNVHRLIRRRRSCDVAIDGRNGQ